MTFSRFAAVVSVLALAACSSHQDATATAPSNSASGKSQAAAPETTMAVYFSGLPVAGSGVTALRYGFTNCTREIAHISCTKYPSTMPFPTTFLGNALDSISVDLEPEKGQVIPEGDDAYSALHYKALRFELSNRNDCLIVDKARLPDSVEKIMPGQPPACSVAGDKYDADHDLLLAGWIPVHAAYMSKPPMKNGLIFEMWIPQSPTEPLRIVTGAEPTITVTFSPQSERGRAVWLEKRLDAARRTTQ